jgi:hypothetical protein
MVQRFPALERGLYGDAQVLLDRLLSHVIGEGFRAQGRFLLVVALAETGGDQTFVVGHEGTPLR